MCVCFLAMEPRVHAIEDWHDKHRRTKIRTKQQHAIEKQNPQAGGDGPSTASRLDRIGTRQLTRGLPPATHRAARALPSVEPAAMQSGQPYWAMSDSGDAGTTDTRQSPHLVLPRPAAAAAAWLWALPSAAARTQIGTALKRVAIRVIEHLPRKVKKTRLFVLNSTVIIIYIACCSFKEP